jgi:hypothetical protein
MWSWVPGSSEVKITVLVKASSSLPETDAKALKHWEHHRQTLLFSKGKVKLSLYQAMEAHRVVRR